MSIKSIVALCFILMYGIGNQCDCNFPAFASFDQFDPDKNIKDTPETGLPRFGSCPVTMTGLSTVMVAPIAVPSTGS